MNRILFVDDEHSVLAGLRRMLRSRHGAWDMAFAEDGQAALRSLEATPADAIVTDFRMPGMDGGSLLDEVRHRFPDTVRLVLSGHTDERDLLGVTDLAHQFLTKPCPPEDLQRVLERVLAAREAFDAPIRPLVSALGALPSAPRAVAALEAVLEETEADSRIVANALGRDVALSAKVLQLVNSSFFAPGARITSLQAAVARAGLTTIRALTARASTAARGLDDATAAVLEDMNDHAVAVARWARKLAAPAAADDACCAALLHTVGAAAIRACSTSAAFDGPWGTFGEADHCAIGAYLLELWGLPPEVTGAVAGLHLPDPTITAGSADLDAGAAARAAHHLTTAAGPALPGREEQSRRVA